MLFSQILGNLIPDPALGYMKYHFVGVSIPGHPESTHLWAGSCWLPATEHPMKNIFSNESSLFLTWWELSRHLALDWFRSSKLHLSAGWAFCQFLDFPLLVTRCLPQLQASHPYSAMSKVRKKGRVFFSDASVFIREENVLLKCTYASKHSIQTALEFIY